MLSLRIFITAFVSGVMLSACVGVSEQVLSRPQMHQKSRITRNGLIDLGGTKIYIRPANGVRIGEGVNWLGYKDVTSFKDGYRDSIYYSNVAKENKKKSLFYVEVFVVTDQPVFINPKEIEVILKSDGIRRPITYLSPLEKYSTENYSLNLCKPDFQLDNPVDRPIIIPRDKSACFSVAYEVTPPLPSEEFRVDIRGVAINDKKIEIAPILFEGSTEYRSHP